MKNFKFIKKPYMKKHFTENIRFFVRFGENNNFSKTIIAVQVNPE